MDLRIPAGPARSGRDARWSAFLEALGVPATYLTEWLLVRCGRRGRRVHYRYRPDFELTGFAVPTYAHVIRADAPRDMVYVPGMASAPPMPGHWMDRLPNAAWQFVQDGGGRVLILAGLPGSAERMWWVANSEPPTSWLELVGAPAVRVQQAADVARRVDVLRAR